MHRSPKTIIGIDVDGVLADSISVWLQELKIQYKITAKKNDIIHNDLTKLFTSLNRKQVEIYSGPHGLIPKG